MFSLNLIPLLPRNSIVIIIYVFSICQLVSNQIYPPRPQPLPPSPPWLKLFHDPTITNQRLCKIPDPPALSICDLVNSTSWYIDKDDKDCCKILEKLELNTIATCDSIKDPKSWKYTGPNEGAECTKPLQIALRLAFNKCCLIRIQIKYLKEFPPQRSKDDPDLWQKFLSRLEKPDEIAKDFSSDKCFSACFLLGSRAMTISPDLKSVTFTRNHIADLTKNYNDNSIMFGNINRLWNDCIDTAEKEIPGNEKQKDDYPCFIAARFYHCMLTSAAKATKDISLCDDPDDVKLMHAVYEIIKDL